MHKQAIVATAAALTLASCGGSSPLTRAELAKQANAICTQRTQQVAQLTKQGSRDSRALMAAIAPVQAKTIKDLSALKPPTNANTAYNTFIASQKAQLAEIRQIASTGKTNVSATAQEARAHAVARVEAQLGITACG